LHLVLGLDHFFSVVDEHLQVARPAAVICGAKMCALVLWLEQVAPYQVRQISDHFTVPCLFFFLQRIKENKNA
jgi:hypothetical protein